MLVLDAHKDFAVLSFLTLHGINLKVLCSQISNCVMCARRIAPLTPKLMHKLVTTPPPTMQSVITVANELLAPPATQCVIGITNRAQLEQNLLQHLVSASLSCCLSGFHAGFFAGWGKSFGTAHVKQVVREAHPTRGVWGHAPQKF